MDFVRFPNSLVCKILQREIFDSETRAKPSSVASTSIPGMVSRISTEANSPREATDLVSRRAVVSPPPNEMRWASAEFAESADNKRAHTLEYQDIVIPLDGSIV